MKAYAGDIYIEVPGAWDDDSQYVYRASDAEVEIRVETSMVDPVATPEGLLDPVEERLGLLGPLDQLERGAEQVHDYECATLKAQCGLEGDPEVTRMEVLVFKPKPDTAVTVTAIAPVDEADALDDAWRVFKQGLKIVDVV